MTVLNSVLWALVVLTALPAILASLYLLLLTLFSWRATPPAGAAARTRFDVIVPAHNEAAGIGRTIASLQKIAWPHADFRIIVVADNCTDDTAAVAAASGARVIERHDLVQRGKGYALSYAFAQSAQDHFADAVVVVDADSEASGNLLSAIAARIVRGAHAVQVHYDVLNPQASWRTRLMTIAMGAFHTVRSRARERLGLSCGIRGNGWCVTHALLAKIPYRAFSLTEDIEYGIDIGIKGYRVYYCDDAQVYGEMVSTAKSAGTQRQRWEQGRFQLIRERTWPLLRLGLSQPSLICLDLAADLLVLPLSYLGLNIVALAAIATVAGFATAAGFADPRCYAGLLIAAGCLGCVCAYFLRGWMVSGTGWSGLKTLFFVPVFIVWKIIVMLTRGRADEWMRTQRERP
jgi:cellulose synthase/poly-beta-1,6-N-acetylglucosamine synthase-like glycosyltransferase